MTYKDQFVAEVKCKGRILRMKDDVVSLPFGSEYSLLFKNLSSRRVSIKISIDGQDALDYQSLVLEADSTTELEGFLSGTIAKNKFKFIQKTKQIQDHRGDRIDDGMIRIEFAFEKQVPEIIKKTIIHEDHIYRRKEHIPYWNYNEWFNGDSSVKYGSPMCSSDAVRGISSNASGDTLGSVNMVQVNSMCVNSVPSQDEGITVKGSECNQQFRYGVTGELEQSQVIVIRMKGATGSGAQVEAPVTVQTKLQCKTCGTKSKSSFKFCPNCGTFLE